MLIDFYVQQGVILDATTVDSATPAALGALSSLLSELWPDLRALDPSGAHVNAATLAKLAGWPGRNVAITGAPRRGGVQSYMVDLSTGARRTVSWESGRPFADTGWSETPVPLVASLDLLLRALHTDKTTRADRAEILGTHRTTYTAAISAARRVKPSTVGKWVDHYNAARDPSDLRLVIVVDRVELAPPEAID